MEPTIRWERAIKGYEAELYDGTIVHCKVQYTPFKSGASWKALERLKLYATAVALQGGTDER